jgi:hypothetical protein
VPFAQRIYDLAVPAGFTGQITSNSFMKREFGRKLIEQFYAGVDLNLVIDTSGTYIPGHGTPTVIICGRNRRPVTSTVRAVLGIRGEPSTPNDPAKGKVWTSIKDHIGEPGTQTDWISVTDLPRDRLATHPWSLSGGGASEVRSALESMPHRLERLFADIGMTVLTLEDDVYQMPGRSAARSGVASDCVPLVSGDDVRDYAVAAGVLVVMPNDWDGTPRDMSVSTQRYIWSWRTNLKNRLYFGRMPEQRKLRWFDLGMYFDGRHRTPKSIAYAEVATHNHFVLDRGGKVFKQTAPVIKLPEGAAEEDHLWLLGLLNSSTACFWLKQVCHNKGSTVDTRGARQTTVDWENFYAFNSTKLKEFPVPEGARTGLAAHLDALATELQRVISAAVAPDGVPTRARLDETHAEWERIRGEMILAQEELDWQVYGLYGLLGDDADSLVSDGLAPPLKLGERSFEIALARKIANGEAGTEWFTRHRSTPITELPTDWPSEYRALVERRLTKIESDPYLHLIERPECKRRWAGRPWDDLERDALRDSLCDRLEDRALWFRPDPRLCSVAQLADALRTDADFVAVAGLYMRDADLTDVVAELVRDQLVPFLATFRYTESGMRVRREWERTWELQRQEDEGKKVGNIPVPLKYKQGDFRDKAYWRNRGKLDVPKERFIFYPDCSRDGTLLLGWAGWDHLQQAQALAAYISERRELDAWAATRLTPLLAGLAELLPWLRQWHGVVDPAFGQSPAGAYEQFLDQQLLSLRLTQDDLTAWKPQLPPRGRRTAQRAVS